MNQIYFEKSNHPNKDVENANKTDDFIKKDLEKIGNIFQMPYFKRLNKVLANSNLMLLLLQTII